MSQVIFLALLNTQFLKLFYLIKLIIYTFAFRLQKGVVNFVPKI